jgi:RNA polymerase sigma-70 factor (sigma-E family)
MILPRPADRPRAIGSLRGGGKGIGVPLRIWGVEQDRTEFAEFYAAARDDCLRIVLISAGDRELAEDLVAEAFSRAWMSWRTVRDHPAPRAWVVRTALNTRVSWWRRRHREVALDGHDVAAATSQHPALDDSLVTALRRRPVRQREVIALRLLLDLDTETTARVLGISSGTVGAHLHRALAALRDELGPPMASRPANERPADELGGRRSPDRGAAHPANRTPPDLSRASR